MYVCICTYIPMYVCVLKASTILLLYASVDISGSACGKVKHVFLRSTCWENQFLRALAYIVLLSFMFCELMLVVLVLVLRWSFSTVGCVEVQSI